MGNKFVSQERLLMYKLHRAIIIASNFYTSSKKMNESTQGGKKNKRLLNCMNNIWLCMIRLLV